MKIPTKASVLQLFIFHTFSHLWISSKWKKTHLCVLKPELLTFDCILSILKRKPYKGQDEERPGWWAAFLHAACLAEMVNMIAPVGCWITACNTMLDLLWHSIKLNHSHSLALCLEGRCGWWGVWAPEAFIMVEYGGVFTQDVRKKAWSVKFDSSFSS